MKIEIYKILKHLTQNEKNKYVDLITNILKNDKSLNQHFIEIGNKLGILNEIKHFNLFEKIIFITVCEYFTLDEINSIIEFCDLNEKNLIKQNDITKYKTMLEVTNAVEVSKIIKYDKELEKQTLLLLNNDIWLIVRPLTHQSSIKYGYNTKWCTTSTYDRDYFERYSNNGILIYCINKINGYKLAVYRSLIDEEFSFWSQKDLRVDSMQTELTDDIKKLIYDTCFDENCRSNSYYYEKNKFSTLDKKSNELYIGTCSPLNDTITTLTTNNITVGAGNIVSVTNTISNVPLQDFDLGEF